MALPSAAVQELVCSAGKRARSEICKHSRVGERLRCSVYMGELSGCTGSGVRAGRGKHSLSPCCFPRRCSIHPSAFPAALLQVKPSPHLRPVRAVEAVGSAHQAPCAVCSPTSVVPGWEFLSELPGGWRWAGALRSAGASPSAGKTSSSPDLSWVSSPTFGVALCWVWLLV